MFTDVGPMLSDVSLSSLLADSSAPVERSGHNPLRYPHHRWRNSASSFSGWSVPISFGALKRRRHNQLNTYGRRCADKDVHLFSQHHGTGYDVR